MYVCAQSYLSLHSVVLWRMHSPSQRWTCRSRAGCTGPSQSTAEKTHTEHWLKHWCFDRKHKVNKTWSTIWGILWQKLCCVVVDSECSKSLIQLFLYFSSSTNTTFTLFDTSIQGICQCRVPISTVFFPNLNPAAATIELMSLIAQPLKFIIQCCNTQSN